MRCHSAIRGINAARRTVPLAALGLSMIRSDAIRAAVQGEDVVPGIEAGALGLTDGKPRGYRSLTVMYLCAAAGGREEYGSVAHHTLGRNRTVHA